MINIAVIAILIVLLFLAFNLIFEDERKRE